MPNSPREAAPFLFPFTFLPLSVGLHEVLNTPEI